MLALSLCCSLKTQMCIFTFVIGNQEKFLTNVSDLLSKVLSC